MGVSSQSSCWIKQTTRLIKSKFWHTKLVFKLSNEQVKGRLKSQKNWTRESIPKLVSLSTHLFPSLKMWVIIKCMFVTLYKNLLHLFLMSEGTIWVSFEPKIGPSSLIVDSSAKMVFISFALMAYALPNCQ